MSVVCKFLSHPASVNRSTLNKNPSRCSSAKHSNVCRARSKLSVQISNGINQNRQRSVATRVTSNEGMGETEEQTTARRTQETLSIEEKMIAIYNSKDFRRELEAAGNDLLVLEVESNEVCESGIEEVPDKYWKDGKPDIDLQPCVNLKHTLQRCAWDCPDVKFLNLMGDMDQESRDLCKELDVTTIPCIQFYRNGKLLWSITGADGAQQEVGEGVLYYGGYAAAGSRTGDFIQDITSKAELQDFLQSAEGQIAVVNVSTEKCEPCVKIFPAVLALAKNMMGYVKFARLVGDANEETLAFMKDYNILEVPTFLFFKQGEEKQRFVGSSRGDLIGQILTIQGVLGDEPLPARRGFNAKKQSGGDPPPRTKSGQAMW